MTAKFRRPADLAQPPDGWNSTRASFDLDGLSAAEASGVLLQWALSRHMRAEITRAGYSSRKEFAETNGLSVDRVRSFFNGHRRANFEDLASFVEILGPRSWPEPKRLARYIEGARLRSSDIGGRADFSLYTGGDLDTGADDE